jgi:hypothetical protein
MSPRGARMSCPLPTTNSVCLVYSSALNVKPSICSCIKGSLGFSAFERLVEMLNLADRIHLLLPNILSCENSAHRFRQITIQKLLSSVAKYIRTGRTF